MTAVSLFCLPFAGAGATFYRAWAGLRPDQVTVLPLQLAGREERFSEPTYPSLAAAVADLSDAVASALETGAAGEPFILFGHSFGALLAFEITRVLCADGGPKPARLMVSGSGHPGLALGRQSAGLGDDEFVARVQQLAGYVHPALEVPELREMVLPVLRADVDLHEAYQPASHAAVEVPITVLRGAHDELVSEADSRGWADWTVADCQYRELDGGHMYLAEHPATVLDAAAEVMRLQR